MAQFAFKKFVFVLIALASVWLFVSIFSVQNTQFSYGSVFPLLNDQQLTYEIEKLDLDAQNQSCHMRVTSKRLNTLLNLVSQKEVIFEHQLKKLKVLFFNSPSSSKQIMQDLVSYVDTADPNDLKVKSSFIRMLYAKSFYFSFGRDRKFQLLERKKVSAI